MANEEVKSRKYEIQKRVQQLSANIGNPTVRYSTPNAEQSAKEELDKLIEEYRALPVEEVEGRTITMGITISLSDGRYVLKYIQGSNRWDFYEGSEYKSSMVKWLDESTAKISVPTRNSDTHGETVNYVFRVKVAPTVDPFIAKLSTPQPQQEPQQPEIQKDYPEDLSMTGWGFVRDANGKWVHAEKLQQQQQPQSTEPKKKRKFFK